MWCFFCSTGCVPSSETDSDQAPRRGFWLTNIDSQAMFSEEGLEQVVNDCVAFGFNTIYVAVWNRGYTLYPSDLMQKEFDRHSSGTGETRPAFIDCARYFIKSRRLCRNRYLITTKNYP